jgi:hypothetical protein
MFLLGMANTPGQLFSAYFMRTNFMRVEMKYFVIANQNKSLIMAVILSLRVVLFEVLHS